MSTVAQDLERWRAKRAARTGRVWNRLAVILYVTVQFSWFALLALGVYWLF